MKKKGTLSIKITMRAHISKNMLGLDISAGSKRRKKCSRLGRKFSQAKSPSEAVFDCSCCWGLDCTLHIDHQNVHL